VIDLIQSLRGPIIGADVVELNPSVDPANITAPLAAKMVKEIIDRMLATAHPIKTVCYSEASNVS